MKNQQPLLHGYWVDKYLNVRTPPTSYDTAKTAYGGDINY